MKSIELTYAGGLELEKVLIYLDKVVSIQKPKSDKFGCIITMMNGEKFPVTEKYDTIREYFK